MNIAIVVDRPQIFERARHILVDEVWGATDSSKVPAVARQPHEPLLYAESIGDKELIGFAYYQLLVSGDKTGLTPSLCQTLNRGMTRCGEEWEKIFNSWGQGEQVSGGSLFYCEICGHGGYISADKTKNSLQSLWPTIARASLPWYDVVGKLRSALTLDAYNPYCCRRSIGPVKRELSRIEKEVYSYFMKEGSV